MGTIAVPGGQVWFTRVGGGPGLPLLVVHGGPGLPHGYLSSLKRLADTREESARLRQTLAGPHRDELALRLNGLPLHFASEGQQRTVALALRLAQARLIAARAGRLPLLLLDDIFGELDPARRNALLRHLPEGSQQIFTTTHLDWMDQEIGRVFRLE